MDAAFLKERIAATKLQIVAFEDALLQLGTNGMQSYTIDTGQDRQTVTRIDLPWINQTIDSLNNRLVNYNSRLYGSGGIGVPAW